MAQPSRMRPDGRPEGTVRSATVSPAYGRDYTTLGQAQQDLLAGKDFWCHVYSDGAGVSFREGYCSLRDFAHGARVTIRYNRMRDSGVVVVQHGSEELE